MGKIIIPVRNEEESIQFVLEDILNSKLVDKSDILVVDNGSTDNSIAKVNELGVFHLTEPIPGYGAACLRALAYLEEKKINTDWILFMDGDRSDSVADIPRLLQPIQSGEADFVIGDRTFNKQNKHALEPLQRFGNLLICFLIRIFYFQSFRDLGPFRVIRYESLKRLSLKDNSWGWNVEMQVRAIQEKLKIVEVPVTYRKRHAGKSKISGNKKMILPVGFKMLSIFFYLLILKDKYYFFKYILKVSIVSFVLHLFING
jgi:glycosyltransferase involved in cell wall biosynthesis